MCHSCRGGRRLSLLETQITLGLGGVCGGLSKNVSSRRFSKSQDVSREELFELGRFQSLRGAVAAQEGAVRRAKVRDKSRIAVEGHRDVMSRNRGVFQRDIDARRVSAQSQLSNPGKV